MQKILLTGGSGFLGGNFCRIFAGEYSIYALWHQNPVNLKNIHSIQVDITDKAVLQKHLNEIRPDAVIHLAGYTDPNKCQLNPELSKKLNVEVSENVALACKALKIPMLFSSTDLVFDGEHAPYSEEDFPKPISI